MNKKSVIENPMALKFICIASAILAGLIPSLYRLVFVAPASPTDKLLSAIPCELFLVVLVVAISYKLGFKNVSISKPAWKKFYWLVPEAFLIFLVFSMITEPETSTSGLVMGKLLFLAVLVGVYEELLSRGLILHIFSRFGGIKRAILVSGLVFGLFHISSYDGANGADTFLQIVETAAAGIYAGVMTLALRSIIPLILTHTLFDYFQFVGLYIKELNQAATVHTAAANLFDISNYMLAILYVVVAFVIYMLERKNIKDYLSLLMSDSNSCKLEKLDFAIVSALMFAGIIAVNAIF